MPADGALKLICMKSFQTASLLATSKQSAISSGLALENQRVFEILVVIRYRQILLTDHHLA